MDRLVMGKGGRQRPAPIQFRSIPPPQPPPRLFKKHAKNTHANARPHLRLLPVPLGRQRQLARAPPPGRAAPEEERRVLPVVGQEEAATGDVDAESGLCFFVLWCLVVGV